MEMKLIFTDLDGTLLTDDKRVCDSNKEAIDMALKDGHKVITATGRPLESAILGVHDIGLDKEGCYILSYNGGLIYDCTTKEVIFKQEMNMDDVKHLYDDAKKWNLHFQTYNHGKVYVEEADSHIIEYHRKGKMPYEVHKDIIGDLTEAPVKALVIDYDHAKLEEFLEYTLPWHDKSLDAFFSTNEYLEYMPKGINKGDGVKRLAEVLGVPMENTIAIGDERNDTSMIIAAGVGVAMKNAILEVKECADYVTTLDNNEGGFAEAIKKFVL